MTNFFGLVIESLVAVLLLLTIGYCVLLNRQLKRLKADEGALKATISELVAATNLAERAIGGLKATVHDCDQNLGERLRNAERLSAEMERQFVAGETLLSRLSRILAASNPDHETKADTRAIVAAAQAFADRARSRVAGMAA